MKTRVSILQAQRSPSWGQRRSITVADLAKDMFCKMVGARFQRMSFHFTAM